MEQTLAQQQWVDIVVPAAPESDLYLWLLLAGLCSAVITSLAWWFWYRRPRQRLHRCIRQLSRTLGGTDDCKSLLIQLESALCRFHDLPYLYPSQRVVQHWYKLFDQLTRIRYQKQQPSVEQTRQLLQQSRQLLRQREALDAD